MEPPANPANCSRRNEDIALDLLKFVASAAGVGRTATPSTGFVAASAAKPEEQVNQLLDLYGKCLRAVQAQPAGESASQRK